MIKIFYGGIKPLEETMMVGFWITFNETPKTINDYIESIQEDFNLPITTATRDSAQFSLQIQEIRKRMIAAGYDVGEVIEEDEAVIKQQTFAQYGI